MDTQISEEHFDTLENETNRQCKQMHKYRPCVTTYHLKIFELNKQEVFVRVCEVKDSKINFSRHFSNTLPAAQ